MSSKMNYTKLFKNIFRVLHCGKQEMFVIMRFGANAPHFQNTINTLNNNILKQQNPFTRQIRQMSDGYRFVKNALQRSDTEPTSIIESP